MKYICVQPRIIYYAWQLEIMINNFLKNGISGNDMEIILAYNLNDETSNPNNIELFNKLKEKYNYVRFFEYEDTRSNYDYAPSVYFNQLKQHFEKYPELSNETIFFHDSDILFTKPLNFSSMSYDNIWYLSDTNSYINSTYLLSKGEDVYNEMCDIVGIDPIIPKLMNSNSGGAQYLTKGTNSLFWNKVESDSINLYKYLREHEKNYIKKHDFDYCVQVWTAGMWAFLWNIWKLGKETKVDKRLDFCWATDPIQFWEEKSIFHNAGVDSSRSDLFRKFDYTHKLPYLDNFDEINNQYCSYNYVKELQEVSNKTCLL